MTERSGFWRAAAAAAAIALAAPAALAADLLERRESLYNNIFIFGDKDTVTMTFGHNKRYYTESSMKLAEPTLLTVDYTRYMTLGVAYAAKPDRILEIGLGGGRTVSYLKMFMPDTAILAVEIDKDVVDLAKKYFKFTESASMRAVVADGRSFLMRDPEKWDVILIDAYRGPFVPFHLLTREFYTLVKSRLAPGGVVVQNIEPSTMLFDSATTTLASVFPSVDLYDGGGNVVAVAYEGQSLRQADLLARAARAQERFKFRHDLRAMAQARRVLSRPVGKVMTDDFAPVETLRAIEKHNEKWKEQTDAPR
ncbi:MAG: spermidine synthase [Alphaproteobacteria bacterium]|nr:spermidine synthase [Alphaproteobacteria bacterium]